MKAVKSYIPRTGGGTSYSLDQTLLPHDVSFSHGAQRRRQTDRCIMPAADHTVF